MPEVYFYVTELSKSDVVVDSSMMFAIEGGECVSSSETRKSCECREDNLP
jgi:hypothetical protein